MWHSLLLLRSTDFPNIMLQLNCLLPSNVTWSTTWDQDCGEKYQQPQICRTPPLWQKVKKNWRASWWKWKRRVKNWLKAQHSENEDHGIWSPHFMTNRWWNSGNSDQLYFFLGSKITVHGDCNHDIKRYLLLGRKAMNNLDSILKSRDITLPTKVCLVKAMVFPVVMYGCESWTVKKAERRRIDAFEVWCWRRLLRVPWTARRSTSPF